MSTNTCDVIIIGSGPAGYTAAIYAARAGLEPLMFAGSIDAGGALMTTTDVENFPGFPEGVMGPELMMNLQQQAERFGTDIRLEDVESVELDGAVKSVTTSDGETFRVRSVILAMGSAYKELGLPEEKALTGHGLSWCATCDGFFFKDQHIAVVGGGDSAMEEALFLTRFASKVTIIHRRDELRASKIMADRAMADPKIEFSWNSEVAQILGDGRVTGVRLRDTVSGEERDLEVGAVFVAIGHLPRTELVEGQIELKEGGYIKVSSPSTHTNIPGVFAAGDVVDDQYRQAITAAGTGCAAALDAERFLAEESAASSAELATSA